MNNLLTGGQLEAGASYTIPYNGKPYFYGDIIHEMGGFMVTNIIYEPKKWYEFWKRRKISGYEVRYIGW